MDVDDIFDADFDKGREGKMLEEMTNMGFVFQEKKSRIRWFVARYVKNEGIVETRIMYLKLTEILFVPDAGDVSRLVSWNVYLSTLSNVVYCDSIVSDILSSNTLKYMIQFVVKNQKTFYVFVQREFYYVLKLTPLHARMMTRAAFRMSAFQEENARFIYVNEKDEAHLLRVIV